MPPLYQCAPIWPCWSRVEMAACLDVLTIPGAVVGSVLLLALSSNPVWGELEAFLSTPIQISQPFDHTCAHAHIKNLLHPVMTHKKLRKLC